jgi:hypothetical protein
MNTKFAEFFDIEVPTIDEAKKRFVDNMDMLQGMPVEQQTLYKKWKEVKANYRNKVDPSRVTKAKIWTPTDIMDKKQTIREIEEMQPRIIPVKHGSAEDIDWLMLRIFTSTFQFDQNPGRFVKFLVKDETTNKYLGVVSISSDVISISCRDEWIGWPKDVKLGGKLNNSAIGSCIVPTQPFGYNFLGGKLVASMLTTQAVADVWERLYDDVLVGLTTTSLYGGHSMYQRIPFWRELGKSKGMISIKPDDDVYEEWHHWIKENMAQDYQARILSKDTSNGPVTGIKQQILNLIFKAVGVSQSKYKHGFERGVYYAARYENTREFLRGEITKEQLIRSKKLEKDVDSILEWWKPKALARYERLHEEGRLNPNTLFYNKLTDMNWEEAQNAYLKDVGR